MSIVDKKDFNIKEEAQKLLGMMIFDELDSKEFVNWAVNSIMNGFNSESLIILAGLDISDTEERTEYFRKSLDELNIVLKEEKLELLKELAIHTSFAAINNQLSSLSALRKMPFICGKANYDGKYISFYEINDDIGIISDGFKPNYILDLNKNNIAEKLNIEFVKFLEENDGINFRKTLKNKSDNQLIEIKYFEKKSYSKASIHIIDDLLSERRLTNNHQLELKKIIGKERNLEKQRIRQVEIEKKGFLGWLLEILIN